MALSSDEALDALEPLLGRSTEHLDWLTPLRAHIDQKLPSDIAAVGLDTGALKQLRRDSRASSDVLAFLEAEDIKTIVPGQAAQEFWNNHSAFLTDVEGIVSALAQVTRRLERITGSDAHVSRADQIRDDVLSLTAEFQDLENPNLLAESLTLWEKLGTIATVSFVPRSRFASLGRDRFDTKTPPGFEDDKKVANKLGDFFVWADFLLGLLTTDLSSRPEGKIVLVTEDDKADWKTAGVPHPILQGEIWEATGRAFELVGTLAFVKYVRSR